MAMEEMAGGEVGNGGKHLDVGSVVRADGSLSSSKPIADPVVYKLVRVEGDGTLVPATDDEVIEVEDLLEEDKVEQPLREESGQNERFVSSDDFSCRGGDDEDSEGLARSESLDSGPKKYNARREDMFKKVKEEERLRLLHDISDGAPKFANSVAISYDHCEQLHVGDANLLASSIVMANLSSLPTSSIENLKKAEGCVQSKNEKVVSGNFVSNGSEGKKSEVSSAKCDICLDNLSIRELQQTFRATFGRGTSVKDKLWLKRRIAMGLANSCDVSATGFIIEDKSLLFCDELNGVANDDKMDDIKLGDTLVNGEIYKFPRALDSENEGRLAGPMKKSMAANSENYSSEDPQTEQRVAKRLRKPTKRYIEELSEADTKESNGKSSSGRTAHKRSLQNSQSMVVCSSGSAEVAAILTRQDSFGGSGVQVPYVSRLRRGRPRKNFMGLLKHQNDMSATLVKKARGVRCRRQDTEVYNRSWKPKALSTPVRQKAGIGTSNNEIALVPYLGRRQQGLEATKVDPMKDLEEYPLTVPTAKGGTRRKHNRAWTLSEVTRLIEGVSYCGAGRWSEIKRLTFASCAYRTSVDLKDKWRNLLRASAQALTDRALKSSRKHYSIPIPAQILVRVRELAAKQSPSTSKQYVKLASKNGKNVHNKPGFMT